MWAYFPRYRARHQVWGKAQFLYRSSLSGSWMVGTTDGIARNAGRIQSSTAGALVPLGLQWEVVTGGGAWQADAALAASLPEAVPPAPAAVVLHSHTGKQAPLMGFYERDGEANGFPRYRARHKAKGKERFLYRNSNGRWKVGVSDSIARNAGHIKSSTSGALVPLGLQWDVKTGGAWQADAALFAMGGGPSMAAAAAVIDLR